MPITTQRQRKQRQLVMCRNRAELDSSPLRLAGREMLSWFFMVYVCNDAPVGKLSGNTCVISLYSFFPKKDENCQAHIGEALLAENRKSAASLNSGIHAFIAAQFPAETGDCVRSLVTLICQSCVVTLPVTVQIMCLWSVVTRLFPFKSS